MAKNIKSLQLLRNTTLFADRNAAYNSLSARTADDGTPVLARYKGTDGKIYTLVGYYATENGTGAAHMTIFDFEGSAAEVEELKDMIGTGVTTANTITKQLQDLSGNTDTSVSADTSVEGAKRYADEKVRAELDKLDYNLAKDDSKVVVSFEQKDGKISGASETITRVKLSGLPATADTKIAETDTLGAALGKLQGQIDSMDKAASAVAGQVVTTVAEADGKVTETKANVKDLQLGGYAKDASATGAIDSADTINTALSKLENKVGANKITNADHSIVVTEPTGAATTTDIKVNIKSGEKVIKLGNDGIYTNLSLVKVTDGLPATVKERYELHDSDNAKIGESIDIAKDSHIVSITYITNSGDTHYQNLEYKYIDASGNTQTEYVDMKSLVLETEFDSGVTVTNGVAHGVVDASSEKNSGGTAFLTVGKDGFKVDGIKQEIINRINALDATVTGGTTAGTATNGHIQVVVGEADGKLTGVTVTETNIADADDLATLSAKTVTEIESSNNSITATKSQATDGTSKYDIITDASKVKMTGFTSDTSGFTGITSASTVIEAVKSIETEFLANEATVSAALNDLEETKVENITVNGVNGTFSNKVASVTIDGNDVVLGADYTKPAQGSAIATGDTVDQALGKLEAKVDAATSDGITGATVNNAPLAITNNRLTQTVIGKQSEATATGNEAIVVETDATGNLTLGIASLDAGTY